MPLLSAGPIRVLKASMVYANLQVNYDPYLSALSVLQ